MPQYEASNGSQLIKIGGADELEACAHISMRLGTTFVFREVDNHEKSFYVERSRMQSANPSEVSRFITDHHGE